MRILAIADEVDPSLSVARLREMKPDLVVSCGDLDLEYIDFISSAANASLVLVPGNHDADFTPRRDIVPGRIDYSTGWGGHGPVEDLEIPGINVDGQVVTVKDLTIAGLGGSILYNDGPNQYTDRQMARRARRLQRRVRLSRSRVDVFLAHSPPFGLGDDDGPHQGFASFISLIETLQPKLMLHGHIHPHGFDKPDRTLGATRVINVIPHKVVEL